ncbi:hypothetical protein A9264_02355 [Vibrio sp. UCD-FRSSP16_10]|uniref:hypothetical protein n=1 Tax=unclassified Vibrio TaxID=2614977 RepID=UPI0007FED1AA|nr:MULTISPECIES: hypothetical protein [unclassified Vibrio]OBT14000.1 hypothetical protein A9260_03805 [Vibrio sp. UCD-FRSSP16_30]OBT22881.1 hypothetical protein A9264_02355 [Vibrio sp. UCD-FRSSP16_10]
MYLVLYCHNIGMTDFSFFETDDFDKDEGYIVRGKWPNERAFKDHLTKEFSDLTQFTVIDLIAEGASAELYTQNELLDKAKACQ